MPKPDPSKQRFKHIWRRIFLFALAARRLPATCRTPVPSRQLSREEVLLERRQLEIEQKAFINLSHSQTAMIKSSGHAVTCPPGERVAALETHIRNLKSFQGASHQFFKAWQDGLKMRFQKLGGATE